MASQAPAAASLTGGKPVGLPPMQTDDWEARNEADQLRYFHPSWFIGLIALAAISFVAVYFIAAGAMLTVHPYLFGAAFALVGFGSINLAVFHWQRPSYKTLLESCNPHRDRPIRK